ncbi:MAG: MBL fold metallo-hydrolase [Rickettsiales bacterium]|jgi:glyoxylase-like metal-dependent hydrolase (beta-lactamase superfamily II)|nr:MBL fold metallo-hydrolase [Rickettsiales bacterium]
MKFEIRILGAMANNSVVIEGDRRFVVDPSGDATDWRGGADAFMATHGHFDHISGLAGLNAEWFMDLDDIPVLNWSNSILPLPVETAPRGFGDLDGPRGMLIIKTPGHSVGSVCLYFPEEKVLLSGDTLFFDTIGRTDVPTGDRPELERSVDKLKNFGFDDDVLVIPGHGRTGFWRELKEANRFLS